MADDEERLIHYYQKRGELGIAKIRLHSFKWIIQQDDNPTNPSSSSSSSSSSEGFISKIKLLSHPYDENKGIKQSQIVFSEERGDGSLADLHKDFSFEIHWKCWIGSQFTIAILIRPPPPPPSHTTATSSPSKRRKKSRLLLSDPIFIEPEEEEEMEEQQEDEEERIEKGNKNGKESRRRKGKRRKVCRLYSKSFDCLDGQVTFSIDYQPNPLSFPYLCRAIETSSNHDTTTTSNTSPSSCPAFSSSFLLNSLQELKQAIHRQSLPSPTSPSSSFASFSASSSSAFVGNKVDKELILLSIQFLKEKAENPESLLLPSSFSLHQRRGGGGRRFSFNSQDDRSLPSCSSPQTVSSNMTNLSYHHHQPPPAFLDSPTVASLAKRFLQELYQNLPQVSLSCVTLPPVVSYLNFFLFS